MSSRPGSRGPTRRRGLRDTWWLALPIALAVVGLLLVNRPPETRVPTEEAAAGVEHVHGLGIDPADGLLYAATHNGLFRIPDTGEATRVGDRVQDTMGFTVVGPNHFLGSGHPDINDRELRRPGSPPLLGLIESRDAGETWESLSLLGEADFHSLVAAHGRVYGFDATNGRFMVSQDKLTWEARSQLAVSSFAVDARNPDSLVATTGEGLILSRDGGRSWRRTDGPALVFLASDDDSGLWGLDASGQVFNEASGSGSAPWTRVAELEARPEALLVDGSEIYAAVMDETATEIRRSADSGKTWTVRYRES